MSPHRQSTADRRRTAEAPLSWLGMRRDPPWTLVGDVRPVAAAADVPVAVADARRLAADGARWLSISARPRDARDARAELELLLPLLEAGLEVRAQVAVATSRARVAQAAARAGASMVEHSGDASSQRALARVAARTGCLLMLSRRARGPGHRGAPAGAHRVRAATVAARVADARGERLTTVARSVVGAGDGRAARRADAVAEARRALADGVQLALGEGVDEHQIVLDPGIGRTDRVEHDAELLRRLDEIAALGRPVVVGVPAAARLEGAGAGLAHGALAAIALERGGHLFRVRHAAPVRDALAVTTAVLSGHA